MRRFETELTICKQKYRVQYTIDHFDLFSFSAWRIGGKSNGSVVASVNPVMGVISRMLKEKIAEMPGYKSDKEIYQEENENFSLP